MMLCKDNPEGESSCFGKRRWWEVVIFVAALLLLPALGVIVSDQLRRTRVESIAAATDSTLLNVVRNINRDFSLVVGVTRSMVTLFFACINSSHIPDASLPAEQQQISLIDSKFAAFAAEEIRRSPSIHSFSTRPGNILTQILPTNSSPFGLNMNLFVPQEVAVANRARDGYIAGPRTLRQGFPGLVTWWPIWLRTTDADSPLAVPSEFWGTVGIVVNLTRFVEGINVSGTLASASAQYGGLYVDHFSIAYHMKNIATGNETWFGVRDIVSLSTTRSASTTVSGVESTIYISAKASGESPEEIGAGVGVSAGALLLLVVAYVLYTNWRSLKENERDLSNAPTGADGKPFVIIFTDIDSSTLLWATVPLSMQAAVDTSHEIVKRLVSERNLYIVKMIGDSIMLAVNDPNVAATLMVDIVREHQRAVWPACIDRVYINQHDQDALLDIDDDPNELNDVTMAAGNGAYAAGDEGPVFRGLRIRIGAALGTPKTVFDNVTKSIDYIGVTTNLASRIESAARGGQILVSSEVGALINCGAINNSTLTPAGNYILKGFADPALLYDLCPNELSARTCLFSMPDVVRLNSASERSSGAATACLYRFDIGDRLSGTSLDDFAREVERDDMIFFRALLKTCKPGQKTQFLEMLSSNWRCNGGTADEDRIAKIVHRVSRVKATLVEQAARRAIRQARLQGDAMSNSSDLYRSPPSSCENSPRTCMTKELGNIGTAVAAAGSIDLHVPQRR